MVFGQGLFGISEKLDKKLLVEYDACKDGHVGGTNGSHVGVAVDGFASAVVTNISSLGLFLHCCNL